LNNSTVQRDPVRIECDASAGFLQWLSGAGGSLIVSTYQAGKVALIGWDGHQIRLLMREFDKPLGLAVDGERVALATRHEVWLFANSPALAPDYIEHQPGRYDAIYLPRINYQTGDLNTHDVWFVDGELLLVNTRFSCLARLSDRYNFTPFWKPSFVSEVVPEDRCHLNGLALVEGRARYVTALGTTDTPGGWREAKAGGGVVIDVDDDEIVIDGLSMPHSPRWHDGRLWLLDSGTGRLLVANPAQKQCETVCELSGYLRGLCFVGPYAVVGMSKIREKHIFGGLPIQKRCARLQCGLAVVDTRSGSQVGLFEYTAGCEELYDVRFLPGVFRPTILNLDKHAAREAMVTPGACYWLRPSNELPATTPATTSRPVGGTCGAVGEVAATSPMFPDTGTQL
jgi:uncharacterized protein (TIGR03032 family)